MLIISANFHVILIMHRIMAYIFILAQLFCLENETTEGDVGAAEGEAPEVELVEETPTATEGKHHAYCSYILLIY